MKKNIRTLALILSLMMLVSFMGGCRKDEDELTQKENNEVVEKEEDKTDDEKDDSDDEIEKEDEYAEYEPKDDEKYEIHFLTCTHVPLGEDSFMVNKFNEEFNVDLIPEFIDGTKWDDILNVKLAAGEIPDIFPSKSTSRFISYLEQDLLAEVPKEVIEKYAPDLYAIIEKDYPPAWNVCSLEGKTYGIPALGGEYVFHDPIVWRDDWLTNVGIDKIPDTIEEWEEALTKFRNEDPNKSGKKDTYGASASIFAPVFGAHGAIVIGEFGQFEGIWMEKDGEIVNTIIEPGAKEALALLNKWYENELIDPEFITGENKGGYWAVSTDFVNGRIGVSAHGNPAHWQKTEKGLVSFANEKEMKKIDPDATYEFGNPPLGPDGETRGTTQLPLCTGLSFVFSKDAEPDKIGKMLQMWNWSFESHENWHLNWIGEEGVHHVVKEQDGYKVYDFVKEDMAERQQEGGLGALFFMSDVENTRKVKGAYFDYFEDLGYDENGVIDLASQLYLPSYDQYIVDLIKMATEAYMNIITGAKPIDYFDEFVENWKESGGQQLIDEANEHYKKLKEE